MTEQDPAPEPRRDRLDAPTALAVAVVLLALAGLGALLASQLLIGALRLAAGVLAGLGVGAAVAAVAAGRLPRRSATAAAAALALLAAVALTVPAAVTARVGPLSDHAAADIAPLTDADRVTSLPEPSGPASPVLVHRGDGTAQLLRGSRVDQLEPTGQGPGGQEAGGLDQDGPDPGGQDPDAVLALAAEGTRLLRLGAQATEVLALPEAAAPAPEATVPGTVLALVGDHAVARACEDDVCRLSGYDLSAADPAPRALWTIGGGEPRGPDPAGVELPAAPDEGQAPGLLDAAARTGVVPSLPLHVDPAQGWVQLDPETGFPVGRILAGPEQNCRIATTVPAPEPDPAPRIAAEDGREPPVVLTVCSAPDGAMTARAVQEGRQLWESEPSPPGQWSLRMQDGRVLATGTEAGTDVTGEIVASSHRSQWTAPGGGALQEATTITARLGIDGSRLVGANTAGQLVAYDTAEGTNTWTAPLPEPEGVRGTLEDGTVVVLDAAERSVPLDPRGAHRLRVLDGADGEVSVQTVTTAEIRSLRGLSGGRALVTTDRRTLLLGAGPAG